MNLYESLKMVKQSRAIVAEDSIIDSIDFADTSEIIKFIENVKKTSKDRKELFEDYESMAGDPVIGSAIELIAEDVTQEDELNKSIVWITSDFMDKNLVKQLTKFLEDIDIESKLWSWTYNILRDGGVFLKTYDSDLNSEDNDITSLSKDSKNKIKGKRGYLYEIEPNYCSIYDLQQYGDTVGYGVELNNEGSSQSNSKETSFVIYPKEDYIHIIADRGHNRQKISIKTDETDKLGNIINEKFSVRYGTSYLEKARRAYLMIDMIENLIISVRFGRSSVYRLFKIEVGGSTKVQTSKILNEFKRNLSVTESFNKSTSSYSSSKKPVPMGKNIYIPIRNGKGDVTQELIGGDYEVKDIVDLDYFQNKLFAALRIPKAYLGHEEALPGGIGNQSLTRIDSRYARTVKRYQKIIKNGVKDILNYYCKVIGKEEWINQFEVNMYKLTTAEESDKRDELMTNITLCESLKNLVSDSGLDMEKIYECMFKDILHLDDIYDKVSNKGGKLK